MPIRSRVPSVLPVYPSSQPNASRVMRRPQHTFLLSTDPFAITPFMIAPVLPGETLENLLVQSRAVTDPIKNGLIGWWLEYYFFYVRHRDLVGTSANYSADAQAMMLDPSTDLFTGALDPRATDDTAMYAYKGGANWINACYNQLVQEYFRTVDEVGSGEWDNFTTALGYYPASINRESWTDSLVPVSEMPETDDVFDDADNTTLGELDRLSTMYQAMRDARLTDMDYDDWLATYGVQLPKAEQPGKPELLRYCRDWQYPTNTVEPTTGVPASAVSWAMAERADKKRFFKEPGFIVGLTVCRPKVYSNTQKGSVAGALDNAFAWLPALLQDHPEISLRKFLDAETGPLGNAVSTAYWADLRDLYMYGDQLTNVSLASTVSNMVALPSLDCTNTRYPAAADVDAMFKTTGTNKVRHDGVVHLGIAGRQRDMT